MCRVCWLQDDWSRYRLMSRPVTTTAQSERSQTGSWLPPSAVRPTRLHWIQKWTHKRLGPNQHWMAESSGSSPRIKLEKLNWGAGCWSRLRETRWPETFATHWTEDGIQGPIISWLYRPSQGSKASELMIAGSFTDSVNICGLYGMGCFHGFLQHDWRSWLSLAAFYTYFTRAWMPGIGLSWVCEISEFAS